MFKNKTKVFNKSLLDAGVSTLCSLIEWECKENLHIREISSFVSGCYLKMVLEESAPIAKM